MSKLTLKQKKFVKVTAQTLNPTEGARQAYNLKGKTGVKDKDKQVSLATTIASDNMTKPAIKKALQEVLEEQKVNSEFKTRLMKRNAEQESNIPASNQAIDMLNKIMGDYAPIRSININVTPDNINNRLKELEDELKQLQ